MRTNTVQGQMESDMESTWLIQRLQKPRVSKGKLDAVAQAFCFGGGGGRLSKEAWEVLSPIFSFDYMGAAEFEFGAVPKALSKMVQERENYEAFEFTIPRGKIEKPYSRIPHAAYVNGRRKTFKKEVPARTDDATVYVFCPKEDRDEVRQRIIDCAGRKCRLKEPSMLCNALDPISDYDTRTCGWLELDNGFAFFADREMWERFCELFRPTEEAPSLEPKGTSADNASS